MSFCKTCNKQTLHLYNVDNCNHILHLLLSVFTIGFWIPVWIICGLSSGRGQPTCTVCGTKASGKSVALQVVTALAGIFVVFALFGSFHPKNNSDVMSSPPLSAPEASTPTSSGTPYVNRLVLINGKYVDAVTPQSSATPCLHVTLRRRLRDSAPGLTPRAVLEKFSGMQMIDVHLPTTDGRTIILSRYTQPEADLQLLLKQLKFELPEQPPPKITASGRVAK
jgi:hypothetical protein